MLFRRPTTDGLEARQIDHGDTGLIPERNVKPRVLLIDHASVGKRIGRSGSVKKRAVAFGDARVVRSVRRRGRLRCGARLKFQLCHFRSLSTELHAGDAMLPEVADVNRLAIRGDGEPGRNSALFWISQADGAVGAEVAIGEVKGVEDFIAAARCVKLRPVFRET